MNDAEDFHRVCLNAIDKDIVGVGQSFARSRYTAARKHVGKIGQSLCAGQQAVTKFLCRFEVEIGNVINNSLEIVGGLVGPLKPQHFFLRFFSSSSRSIRAIT